MKRPKVPRLTEALAPSARPAEDAAARADMQVLLLNRYGGERLPYRVCTRSIGSSLNPPCFPWHKVEIGHSGSSGREWRHETKLYGSRAQSAQPPAGVAMLTELPRVIADRPDRPDLGDLAVHMGQLTREIAMDPGAWTPERLSQMLGFFDSLASTWAERDNPERHDSLGDALARGGPFPGGVCLEVGAGTGNVTGDLQAVFEHVVSFDLSRAMLSLASPRSRQIQADASILPVRSNSVAAVALVNMFLFPDEVRASLKQMVFCCG